LRAAARARGLPQAEREALANTRRAGPDAQPTQREVPDNPTDPTDGQPADPTNPTASNPTGPFDPAGTNPGTDSSADAGTFAPAPMPRRRGTRTTTTTTGATATTARTTRAGRTNP
jgi:hypothetical protein